MVLVEAACQVAVEFPGLRLRLLGRDEGKLSRHLLEIVNGRGLAGLIELPGFVPRQQLPAEFARAHVFAAPSVYEGGPGFVYLRQWPAAYRSLHARALGLLRRSPPARAYWFLQVTSKPWRRLYGFCSETLGCENKWGGGVVSTSLPRLTQNNASLDSKRSTSLSLESRGRGTINVARNPFTCRLLHGFDDPQLDGERWEELVTSSQTRSVFQTKGWQKAWWDSYGRGKLVLVLAERNGCPSALAPLFCDCGMLFFVGSGGSDYLDFLGDTSDDRVLVDMLTLARKEVANFVGFRFYHVPDGSQTGKRVQRVAGSQARLFRRRIVICAGAGLEKSARAGTCRGAEEEPR